MLVIVIEGPVGAGKTTLVKSLKTQIQAEFLEELDFSHANLNGKEYNPLDVLYRDSLSKEDYLCCQLHLQKNLAGYYQQKIHEIYKNSSPKSFQDKVIIFDRWIPSCETFVKIRHEMDLLSDFSKDFLLEDAQRKQKRFIKQLTENTDICIFYMNTPPDECLKNIKKRNRPEEVKQTDKFWLKFNTCFHKHATFNNDSIFIGDSENIEKMIKEKIIQKTIQNEMFH